ncbi:DUF927 domain-containing protein [Mesorhizobium sp. M0815]|uniref:DUF927 domain-containing protein n=1 Tax=Mesorhizobium sp. M0815 TaxID=2957005 RepID=UPI003339DFB8
MSKSPSAKNKSSNTTQPSASIHSFEPSQAARQLRAMLPGASTVTLFHRNDEGKREGIVTKPIADIAAAIHEARHLAGDNHVFAALTGLRLAFKDKASANAATDLPEPSYALDGPGGSIHLVYPMKPSDRLATLLTKRRKSDTDDAYTDDDVPLAYGEYGLHADDLAALEALKPGENFRVCKVEEFDDDDPSGVKDEGLSAESEVVSIDGEPTQTLNDAEVYGEIPQAILDKPLFVSVAKKREEKFFKVSPELRFSDILISNLSKIRTGMKDGACLVPGILKDGRRLNQAVTKLYMMGLDVDSGASMEDTMRKLQTMGLFFVAYTTHSHGTTTLEVKKDKFFKWADDNGHPTEASVETVKLFLTNEGKYTEDVIASVSMVNTSHETSGIQLIITTRPIDKFRLLFVLDEPYDISKQPGTQKDAIKAWGNMILGMGAQLGISVDRAATDPARLFYLPSTAKGATNARVVVSAGKALDLKSITKIDVAGTVSSDPFDQAASIMGGKIRGQILSPQKGLHLQKWASERAHGFQISSVFKDHCDDRIRVETGPGKYTVECPFDDDHSNAGDPDDPGCFIQDAGMDAESFTFRCSHDSCAGHDRLAMLEKAMVDGWFTDDVLTDPAYDISGADEEEEGEETTAEEQPTQEEAEEEVIEGGTATTADIARAMDLANKAEVGMASDKISAILKQLLPMGQFDRQRIITLLHKKSGIPLPMLNSLFKAIELKGEGDRGKGFLKGTGFHLDKKGEFICDREGSPVCQPFDIEGHFEDDSGDNATLFLKFKSMGKTKVIAIENRDLYGYGSPAIRDLAGMNFRIFNQDATQTLLQNIKPPLTGQWVSQRGWHGGAFLTLGGETIKPEESSTLTMRMRETTRREFGPMGEFKGWTDAVGAVWEGNAVGREHLALAIMMGLAGPIFGRCHPNGFRMLSLHGPTSRGKSLASKLLASVSGPPSGDGCYLNLRATSNGIEATLPDLSGHTLALDEGQHMKAEHANELVFMMEAGSGKIAATQTRSARQVRRFGGLAMMANEKPWAQKLKDADVDVSPGFDARVLDINVAGVKDYPKGEATALTTRLYGVERNNGWALPMVVRALLNADAKTLAKKVGRLTTALVGKDALGLESRSLESLAWVWLGGILGKKLGIIPAEFSVGRVIRWARDNRVNDASKPVSERVLSALRTSISRRRKIDLYRWESFDPDAFGGSSLDKDVERVNRPWAGFFYQARVGEELIINADALRGMAGNICSETEIAQYLRDAGYLRMKGKNLFHDELPVRDGSAEKVKNYRVVSAFYLAVDTIEAEGTEKVEPESDADADADAVPSPAPNDEAVKPAKPRPENGRPRARTKKAA